VITEYRVLGGMGICAGILLHVAAFNCWGFGAPRPITLALAAVATVALTFGCVNYARGKGYHPLIGLTALVPPLGLVVVSVLPDRRKQEPDAVMRQVHEAKQASRLNTKR
jgi:peptidoglycan/LPS O-acetylase OafA/YrhL